MTMLPALLAMTATVSLGVVLTRYLDKLGPVERLLVALIPDPDLSGPLDGRWDEEGER